MNQPRTIRPTIDASTQRSANAVPSGRRPAGRGPREWARAFTGFYPPLAEELADLDPVARFLYSARSVILVISFQAALLAGLLALTDRQFETVPFVLVLIGYVVLHAISNLSNDYFGARRGHDTEDSPRRRYTVHPVLSGAVSSRLLVRGLLILAVVAVAIGIYFIALRGWAAVLLVAAGALLLWAYDAAPRALKELGLGEVAAFMVWGPLMVAGGYYVIAGSFSSDALLASIPYGLGVMSILVGKHIDQRKFDDSQHQRTLPVLLGERRARAFDRAAVIGMYVVVIVGIIVGALTPFAALVLFAAPRALRAIRVLSAPAPSEPPAGYIGWPLWYHRVCLVHNRAFGWLYILGLVAGALFPGLRSSSGSMLVPAASAARTLLAPVYVSASPDTASLAESGVLTLARSGTARSQSEELDAHAHRGRRIIHADPRRERRNP